MYSTVDEIREANERHGHHWFEGSTMRFFGSRVGQRVYGGRFFISSETPEGPAERGYTIRCARDSGAVETCTPLGTEDLLRHFKTRREAERVLHGALGAEGGRAAVIRDVYPSLADEHTEPNPDRFEWRPIIGHGLASVPLRIGERNTQRAALEFAAELNGGEAAEIVIPKGLTLRGRRREGAGGRVTRRDCKPKRR